MLLRNEGGCECEVYCWRFNLTRVLGKVSNERVRLCLQPESMNKEKADIL